MNSTEYIEKNFALEKAENQNYLGVLYHVESDTIIKFIKSLPTVDAVPVRHGRWIRKEWAEESEGLLIDNYECSACKNWVRNETNYCPYCGAKMDAERKEE